MSKTSRCLGSLATAALVAWSVVTDASAADAGTRMLRIGSFGLAPTFGGPPALIRDELRKLGYVEGKDFVIEYRSAHGDPDQLPAAAAELVKSNVDVILALANAGAFVARNATRTIPIVVWGAHGALEIGLVSNLRRPGGNLTGTESLAPEIDAKRVELLREIVPGLSRLAVLYDAGDQGSAVHLKSAQTAGRALGVAISTLEVRRAEDFVSVLAPASGQTLGGVLTFTSPLTYVNWQRIADFAAANRLPTVCEWRELARAGCLFSYGPNILEYSQRTAAQIDKIFRGTPVGELPVEQMTRFELVINQKTAKALGITIPQSILLRADAVIE
jgi:putative tryptophan/tyrosine transport system substrate-binding protein